MSVSLPRARTIAGATVAGIVAGCSILICLALFDVAARRAPGSSFGGYFTLNAATLVGKAAYSSPASIALGAGVHFAISIGWALGYAVAARAQPQLIRRPLISGAVFGLVVYFALQLVLVAANLYHTPTPRELGIALVAYLVFYGIPVALMIRAVSAPRE